MGLHCEAAKRQTDPETAGNILAFETGKFFKDMLARIGRDARTAILHPKLHVWAVPRGAHLNGGFGMRKFDGILKQVDDHPADHLGIHKNVWQVPGKLDLYLLAAAIRRRQDIFHCAFNEFPGFHALQGFNRLPGFEAVNIQQ